MVSVNLIHRMMSSKNALDTSGDEPTTIGYILTARNDSRTASTIHFYGATRVFAEGHGSSIRLFELIKECIYYEIEKRMRRIQPKHSTVAHIKN